MKTSSKDTALYPSGLFKNRAFIGIVLSHRLMSDRSSNIGSKAFEKLLKIIYDDMII